MKTIHEMLQNFASAVSRSSGGIDEGSDEARAAVQVEWEAIVQRWEMMEASVPKEPAPPTAVAEAFSRLRPVAPEAPAAAQVLDEAMRLVEDYVGACAETVAFNITQRSSGPIRMAKPRLAALRAHLTGMAEDAERLDWLDSNPYAVSPDSYGYLPGNEHRRWMWQTAEGSAPGAPDLRSAIDAGRLAQTSREIEGGEG